MTFTIERPEVIQGALYLASFVVWFDTAATIIVMQGMISRSDRRDALFVALKPHRRSFKNLTLDQLQAVRRTARGILRRPLVVSLIEISIPIVSIAVFGLPAMWQLIRTVIFG
jgi:hypothetical protein